MFFSEYAKIHIYMPVACFPPFSAGRVSCGGVSGGRGPESSRQPYTGIKHPPKFLGSIVIFRLFLPIGIFGTRPEIFRLQKHKFSIKSKILFGYSIFMLTFAIRNKSNNIMKHQYQSNYKPNEFLDVLDEFFNGKLKCQISTYSQRGKVKVKTISLGRDAIEGQWANFHRI